MGNGGRLLNYESDAVVTLVCSRLMSLRYIFLPLSSQLNCVHLIHVKQLFDGRGGGGAKWKTDVRREDEWR